MAQVIPFMLLAGTAMSAIGATQTAAAEKNAHLFNARLQEINALAAHDQATADVARFRRTAAKELGSMRAAFGANTGDALSVLADTEQQMALDEATLKYRGDVRVLGHTDSARLERQAAKNAEAGGFLKSASAFITGLGNTAVYSAAAGGRLANAPAGATSNSFLVP